MTEYFRDFREFLAALQRADVRFLVVGAHALAALGVPRATVDLDVWVDCTEENALRIWRALADFGAPLHDLGISQRDFATPDCVVQLGLPPLRIDILTGLSGVSFGEAWPTRVIDAFADLRVPYIGRDAFLKNKRATGRHKDLGDVESLGETP